MDRPAVNWKVLELFDEKLESKDLPKTLNFGSCSQHSVYGALRMVWKVLIGTLRRSLNQYFGYCMIPQQERMIILEKDKQLFPSRYLYYFQMNIKFMFRAYFRKIKRPIPGRFVIKHLFPKKNFFLILYLKYQKQLLIRQDLTSNYILYITEVSFSKNNIIHFASI